MKKTIIISAVIVAVLASFFSYRYFAFKKYDFTMQSLDGEKTLSSFKGKNIIIYFGYTYCPDVCPATLSLISASLKEIDLENDYKLIFITLDPERDTKKSADEYVKFFYKDSIALIPTLDELKRVTQNYGVKYEKVKLDDSYMNYSVAHSGAFFIFDKDANFKAEVTNLVKSEVVKALKDNR